MFNAKTATNALNTYDDFLGELVENPNTPGSSFENAKDMTSQVTKSDMAALENAVNSRAYQILVNQIRNTNDPEVRAEQKQKLEEMISDTIGENFGLDNFQT